MDISISIVIASLGLFILLIGIPLFIIGWKRIGLNEEIEKENKKLEAENDLLKKEHNFLLKQKQHLLEEQEKAVEHYSDILDLTYQAKELEFDTKFNSIKETFNNKVEKEKELIWYAFQKYVEALEEYYNKVETDFDVSIEKIKNEVNTYKNELDKIQQTYAAAREAQIREEEMLLKAEFYSLHLTESEQMAISILDELKPRFPVPRALSKVIWETFFQKQAASLCSYVLGPGTVCGIYKITNKKNGLCYIGQSVDVANRWKEHIKCGLGIDTPLQNKLYKAMLNDGVVNFTFELLEKCDRKLLNEKEKFYIELYQSCDYGYNSTIGNK